nr:hypothetical protein [Apis mellifera nudivirus]
MHPSKLLYGFLLCVILSSVANFITALILHDERDYLKVADGINFSLTILSGLIINMGTIIQVINIIRAHRSGNVSEIHYDYTTCLVAGCLLLVISQFYAYLLGHNANIEFLCTLLTTILSFCCTFTFWFVNRCIPVRAASIPSLSL